MVVRREGTPEPPPPAAASAASSEGATKISPAVLFTIVILAVIFFIAGLLHLLLRYMCKKRSFRSDSGGRSPGDAGGGGGGGGEALQRQLQQLFHLHDAGLDQAIIDALPVFPYREVVGAVEPFDCPVCLCEFTRDDKLRLLPLCGHAFHVDCIDTWLLSNSTCPLCRGALFVPGDNPVFEFDNAGREEAMPGLQKPEIQDEAAQDQKIVVPVRLGKFRNTNGQCTDAGSNSSNLDGRRCYSMGHYQYVLGDDSLKVRIAGGRGRAAAADEDAPEEGRRISGKVDSLSVSKIWQWPDSKGRKPPPFVDDGGGRGLP